MQFRAKRLSSFRTFRFFRGRLFVKRNDDHEKDERDEKMNH